MDEIATEAGAGKQTIYRWWRSKAEVVLDALRENARVEILVPDTGSLREDISGYLSGTFDTQQRRTGMTRVLQAMMAESQHNNDFADLFRTNFIEPRRETIRTIFVRAHARGEIQTLDDVNLWIDVAFGVLWYRLLAGVGPLDDTLAEKLATLLSVASGARPKGEPPVAAEEGTA